MGVNVVFKPSPPTPTERKTDKQSPKNKCKQHLKPQEIKLYYPLSRNATTFSTPVLAKEINLFNVS